MTTQPRRDHLALVGMMGAGKTTTALALAARIDWPVRDSDRILEERTGLTGAEVAAENGVAELHRLEEEILLETLTDDGPAIVTAASSTVESERARWMLDSRATVVWLDVAVDELTARMGAGGHRRPLDQSAVAVLLARRRAHLAEIADLRLDAGAPTDELVDEIIRFVHDPGV